MMRGWILRESPGTYEWAELPVPEPGPEDVRLRVAASSLNHMDLWLTKASPKPALPHVPGCDAVGVVDAVGARVSGVDVGDLVVVNPSVTSEADAARYGNDSPLAPSFGIWGEHCHGGHAEFAVVPGRNVRPLPAGLGLHEAAAFPLVYLTALRMLRRARLSPGMRVLVVGIGAGVSVAAMDIARHLGAEVWVTSRDAAKRETAMAAGVAGVLDSAEPRWNVAADVVVESVGAATWRQSLGALAPGGRLVVCGATSGGTVEINLPRLFFKQHEIIGSTMGSYEEFDMLLGMIADGLPVRVDSVHDVSRYPEALRRMSEGRHLGKIVLDHGVALEGRIAP